MSKSKEDIDLSKDAIIAEYNVLREEIKQYHTERNNFVNYTVMLSAGFIGSIAVNKFVDDKFLILYLIFPFFYFTLGLLYLDKSIRIIRLADYIHNHLREVFIKISNSPKVFNWENYKKNTKRFPKWLTKLIDRLRISIFIIPSLISLLLFFIHKSNEFYYYEIILICLDILSVMCLIMIHIIAEETSGAKSKKYGKY